MFKIMGSTYFFKEYADFKSKDIDYWEITDNLDKDIKYCRRVVSISRKEEFFSFKRVSKAEHIQQALEATLPMVIGKFLVPEFCAEIGFTVDDLPLLQDIVNKLDENHKYEEIIFKAYLTNRDFSLTQEQRDEAYRYYKQSRNLT